MRQREVEMLLAYFLNYRTVLEGDVTQLRNNIRYRSVDQVDCLEMALALERLNAFDNFTKNVRAILHLGRCHFEDDDSKKDGD